MRQVSCQCLPVQGRFFPRLAVAVGKHEPASQSSQRTLMTLSRSRISLCLPPTSSSSVLSSSCSKLNGEWLSGAPFRKTNGISRAAHRGITNHTPMIAFLLFHLSAVRNHWKLEVEGNGQRKWGSLAGAGGGGSLYHLPGIKKWRVAGKVYIREIRWAAIFH